MFYHLVNGDPQFLTRHIQWLVIATMLLGFTCIGCELPGLLTFMQLAWLTLSAVILRDYRQEAGLWMLAVVLLALALAVFAMGLGGELQDAVRGITPGLSLFIDAIAATSVLKVHMGFLRKVANRNFKSDETQASTN